MTLNGATLTGSDAGNYSLVTVASTTADITPKPITGSFTAADKEYDGNTDAAVTDRSLDGTIDGDDVSLSGGTASFDDKNVGTDKDVTLSGASLSGADASNYTLSSVDKAKADITAKGITGSFTTADKVYDSTTDATVTNRTLNGTVSGDTVSLSGGTATFDNKNVGTDKDVTLNGATLSGADASNYELTSVDKATADITAKELTGSFTANDKEYDGNTDATVADRSLPGVVGTDDVSLDVSGAQFDNKNVGTDKDVTASLALSGADASNYVLSSTTASAKADITAKSITGSFTAADKVYDGNTDATVTDRSLNGVISGDDVSLTDGTASFDDKNVGTDKDVTLSGATLAGNDASNYNLTSVSDAKADITAKPITGSFTAADKEYDGNANATITGRAVSDEVSGDDVSLSGGTASFDDKNVGTDKPVNGTGFSLAGADAGNYTLSSVADTTADITAKSVTGSFTTADKEYDGNTDATVTGRSLDGTIDGDDVSLSGGTATFDNKNVGTDKDVTLNGATLSGADASNYELTSVDKATADITAKELTGSFTANDKEYDGNTDATVADRSLPGVVGTDDVSLDVSGAQFDNKNVGTDKDVTASLALSGADASNYVLSSTTASAKADITAKSITGSFTAADKVYDGNTDATVTGRTLNGAIDGDLVSLTGGSATFDDKNVGTDKTVNGTGFASLAPTPVTTPSPRWATPRPTSRPSR